MASKRVCSGVARRRRQAGTERDWVGDRQTKTFRANDRGCAGTRALPALALAPRVSRTETAIQLLGMPIASERRRGGQRQRRETDDDDASFNRPRRSMAAEYRPDVESGVRRPTVFGSLPAVHPPPPCAPPGQTDADVRAVAVLVPRSSSTSTSPDRNKKWKLIETYFRTRNRRFLRGLIGYSVKLTPKSPAALPYGVGRRATGFAFFFNNYYVCTRTRLYLWTYLNFIPTHVCRFTAAAELLKKKKKKK